MPLRQQLSWLCADYSVSIKFTELRSNPIKIALHVDSQCQLSEIMQAVEAVYKIVECYSQSAKMKVPYLISAPNILGTNYQYVMIEIEVVE